MLKTLAVSTLLLCSTIAFAQPAAARDRDDHRDNRDRDHYARNYDRRDDHDRGVWRAPVRYGDRYGYGDVRYGYYDRFGVWCWY